jgi:polyhydroxyalkanoate synthesis regulator phasin
MNNTNELFGTMVENQKKAVDTFLETTNKFQEAIKTGTTIEKTTEIYQNWWEKQLSLLNNVTTETKNEVEENMNTSQHNVEDFYKKLYENQLDAIKKSSDFNLSFYNTLSNFGKTATDSSEQYKGIQSNWNTLFESWTKTLNNTYESLNKTMPTSLNKDLFVNMFNTNTMMYKLQDFYKPMFNGFKNNNFTTESIQSFFNPIQYKSITEEMFKSFFPTNNLNSLIEMNTKMIQDFFSTQQTTSKETQEFWKLFSDKFPNVVSGDFGKLNDVFKNVTTSYTELFTPALKLVSNSKEKENIELVLTTLDKTSTYSMKLAQIQYLLYTTGQKVAEEVATTITEKAKTNDFSFSVQPFFNEWVKINEKHYSELFGTDTFSKLKAEILTLSLDVKKNIEKQFENRIEHLPLVVKSELNELYQTIHDLKKTIKNLEAKFSAIKTTETKTTDSPVTAATSTTKTTASTVKTTTKKATV